MHAGVWGKEVTSHTLSYIVNEMEMMFSQLAKQSSRVLPAVLCTDDVHYIINQRYNVSSFKKEQNRGGRRQNCFSLLNFIYFGKLQLY